MKRWLFVGLVSGIAVVSGCGESSSKNDGAVELVVPTPSDEGGAAQKVASANRAYRPPVKDAVADPDLGLSINNWAGVLNSDFNDQTEQVPDYWSVNGNVRVLSGGFDKSPALACGKGGARIKQDLLFDGSPAGKSITFTAQSMSVVPGAARIEIQLTNGSTQASEQHPGDSQWHKLTATIQVPEDYEGESATICLIFKGTEAEMRGTVYAAWFDDVNVVIE